LEACRDVEGLVLLFDNGHPSAYIVYTKTDPMKHLLTAIACCLAVTGSAQVQYNPDVDGDGCITVTDVLGILSVFNTCAEGSTLYYFHGDPGQAPWYGNQNLTNQEGAFWITDSDGNWIETTEISAAWSWLMLNQGEQGGGETLVQHIDSINNVSVPLVQSIPFGSINMPEAQSGGGYYFLVISHDVNFPFDEIPVFWQPGVNCGPSPLEEWNLNGKVACGPCIGCWIMCQPV
jgi:hypothetical protein